MSSSWPPLCRELVIARCPLPFRSPEAALAIRLARLGAWLRSEPTPTGWRRWAARLLAWSGGLYLMFALGLWILLATAVDRWWPVSVAAFSPRWLFGLPLFVLIPAGMLLRRRSTWLSAASLALLVGPIMGLCVPWTNLWPGSSDTFS